MWNVQDKFKRRGESEKMWVWVGAGRLPVAEVGGGEVDTGGIRVGVRGVLAGGRGSLVVPCLGPRAGPRPGGDVFGKGW